MSIIPPAWFDVPGYNWSDLSENGRIAARWVHAGAKVFPCYSHVYEDERGNIHDVKSPKTAQGFYDAIDDMPEVVAWWDLNPEDLPGIPCEDWGTIIDIDMDPDRLEPVDGWSSVFDAGLTISEDYMVSTPRGGNHVYRRTPPGLSPNSVTNVQLADGTVLHCVDRKARGGYFIGWSEEGIPENIEELPYAPIEFCHVDSRPSQGVRYSKTSEEWLASIGSGKSIGPMEKARQTIPRGEFGHNAMCKLQRHIIGLAAKGFPGAAVVLEELKNEYLRPPYNTIGWEADYNAALAGGIRKFGGIDEKTGLFGGTNQTLAALALAYKTYEFFPTTDGDILAMPTNGPKVALSIGVGSNFRNQLLVDFHDASGESRALSEKALKDVVGIISGRCLKLPKVEAHLRVAEHGDVTVVDIGDETGRCIHITAEGWSIEDESPVLFRRTKLIGAVPIPERGGTLKGFFKLLNIPEQRKAVYLGFLVSFYFPNIAHPILAAFGVQGSGKSKITEHTHRILDNSPVLGRKLPRNMEEWVVAAQASYLVSLDNVSRLTDDMSDALSRAITGEAAVHRAFYTNKDVELFAFRRVVILNGIDIIGIREDMADRILQIELQQISPEQRLPESSIDSAAAAMAPEVFGALLDVVVLVKRTLPDVQLPRLPRLADFAQILRALEIIYPGLDALNEYELGIEEAAMNSVQQNPVLSAIQDSIGEPWEGTSRELLDLINLKKPMLDESRKHWPNTPSLMTTILARSGPSFTKIGWRVEDLGSRNKQKTRRWRLTPPPVSATLE